MIPPPLWRSRVRFSVSGLVPPAGGKVKVLVAFPKRSKRAAKTLLLLPMRNIPEPVPFAAIVMLKKPELFCSRGASVVNKPLYKPLTGMNGLVTKFAVSTRFDSIINPSVARLVTILSIGSPWVQFEKTKPGEGVAVIECGEFTTRTLLLRFGLNV